MTKITLEVSGCNNCPYLRHAEVGGQFFDYRCLKKAGGTWFGLVLEMRDITAEEGLGKPAPDWCPFLVGKENVT